MGVIYNKFEFNISFIKNTNKAVISCLKVEDTEKLFSNYSKINLGIELSKRLIKFDESERVARVQEELDATLKEDGLNEILITNIDILFNPSYQLEIINYFINLSRLKKVVVQWCGKLKRNKLMYSEPDYVDYKYFGIENYDIICIK